jgi:hypothetical protein
MPTEQPKPNIKRLTVWEKNQKQISVSIKTTKVIKSVTLDGGIFMDADRK